jgi:hypothetical protein
MAGKNDDSFVVTAESAAILQALFLEVMVICSFKNRHLILTAMQTSSNVGVQAVCHGLCLIFPT